MAVAGMTSEGRHRNVDHPKVLRTPPESPRRVRASYHTPGNLIEFNIAILLQIFITLNVGQPMTSLN